MQSSHQDKPDISLIKLALEDFFVEQNIEECLNCVKQIFALDENENIFALLDKILKENPTLVAPPKEESTTWGDDEIDNSVEDDAEFDEDTEAAATSGTEFDDEDPFGPAAQTEEKQQTSDKKAEPKIAPAMFAAQLKKLIIDNDLLKPKELKAPAEEKAKIKDVETEFKELDSEFSLARAEHLRKHLVAEMWSKKREGLDALRPVIENYLRLYWFYLAANKFDPFYFAEASPLLRARMNSSIAAKQIETILEHFNNNILLAINANKMPKVRMICSAFFEFAFSFPAHIFYGDNRIQIIHNIATLIDSDEIRGNLPFHSDFVRRFPAHAGQLSKATSPVEKFMQTGAFFTAVCDEKTSISREELSHFAEKSSKLVIQQINESELELAETFRITKIFNTPIQASDFLPVARNALKHIIATEHDAIIMTFFILKLLSKHFHCDSLMDLIGKLPQMLTGYKAQPEQITIRELRNGNIGFTFQFSLETLSQEPSQEKVHELLIQFPELIITQDVTKKAFNLTVSIPAYEFIPNALPFFYHNRRQETGYRQILEDTLMKFSKSLVNIVATYVGDNFYDPHFERLTLISPWTNENYAAQYEALEDKSHLQEYREIYKDIMLYFQFLGPEPCYWLDKIRTVLPSYFATYEIQLDIIDNLQKLFRIGLKHYTYQEFSTHISKEEAEQTRELFSHLILFTGTLTKRIEIDMALAQSLKEPAKKAAVGSPFWDKGGEPKVDLSLDDQKQTHGRDKKH